jgi:hypothetical protein
VKSVSVLLITFLLAFATVTLIYPSFGPANSPVAEGHPVWTRAIRLPAFGNHSEWVQPGYNAQQILAMISDLRPTLLDRYIGGYQVLTRPVPVCTGCKPMDVLQFLQASENASGAQIMAAISLWNFDNGTLFSITKTMLTIPVNPPIRMLSLDDYSGWIQAHTSTQLTSILNTLHKEGWTYIEAGGCGSHGGIAAGVTNYASVCFRYWQWAVSPNSVGAWKSDSSIKFILGTQDFPRDITYLFRIPHRTWAAYTTTSRQTSRSWATMPSTSSCKRTGTPTR